MTASRWTKRHGSLLLSNRLIYLLSIVLPFSVMAVIGQLRSLLGIALTLALVVGAFTLAKKYLSGTAPYVMSQAIQMEYESAEFALRKLFTDSGIRFQRQLEEDTQTHSFEFLGVGLSLTVRPYDLVNGIELGRDDVSKAILVDRLGVILSLHDISTVNQAFADKLTTAIDNALA